VHVKESMVELCTSGDIKDDWMIQEGIMDCGSQDS
jgi:hypothetical protein